MKWHAGHSATVTYRLPAASCYSRLLSPLLIGSERVEWVTNVEDGSGPARGLGGIQKLTVVIDIRTALTCEWDMHTGSNQSSSASRAQV